MGICAQIYMTFSLSKPFNIVCHFNLAEKQRVCSSVPYKKTAFHGNLRPNFRKKCLFLNDSFCFALSSTRKKSTHNVKLTSLVCAFPAKLIMHFTGIWPLSHFFFAVCNCFSLIRQRQDEAEHRHLLPHLLLPKQNRRNSGKWVPYPCRREAGWREPNCPRIRRRQNWRRLRQSKFRKLKTFTFE